MADKSIGELPVSAQMTDEALLVVYQTNKTESIRGELIKQYARDSVSAYVESASASAEAAGKFAVEADTSKKAAGQAAAEAEVGAASSEQSKIAAENAKNAAVLAETEAKSAKAAAESARDTAQGAAQTAGTEAAEIAANRTVSEITGAMQGYVSAAESATIDALGARDESVSAKTSAQAAAAAAESAENAAQLSEMAAEGARVSAAASEMSAEKSKTDAEHAKTTAGQSAREAAVSAESASVKAAEAAETKLTVETLAAAASGSAQAAKGEAGRAKAEADRAAQIVGGDYATKTEVAAAKGEAISVARVDAQAKADSAENSAKAASVPLATKGAANGVAPLGADGLVPARHIPTAVKEMQVVGDIAQRNAIASKFSGLNVFVKDATGDASVKSGGATYVYDGAAWFKTGEAESMDVVLSWGNIQDKPGSFPPSGHVHSASDINAGILPIARGGTGANTAAGALAALGAAPSGHAHDERYYTEGETLSQGTKAKLGLGESATPDDAFGAVAERSLSKSYMIAEGHNILMGDVVNISDMGTVEKVYKTEQLLAEKKFGTAVFNRVLVLQSFEDGSVSVGVVFTSTPGSAIIKVVPFQVSKKGEVLFGDEASLITDSFIGAARLDSSRFVAVSRNTGQTSFVQVGQVVNGSVYIGNPSANSSTLSVVSASMVSSNRFCLTSGGTDSEDKGYINVTLFGLVGTDISDISYAQVAYSSRLVTNCSVRLNATDIMVAWYTLSNSMQYSIVRASATTLSFVARDVIVPNIYNIHSSAFVALKEDGKVAFAYRTGSDSPYRLGVFRVTNTGVVLLYSAPLTELGFQPNTAAGLAYSGGMLCASDATNGSRTIHLIELTEGGFKVAETRRYLNALTSWDVSHDAAAPVSDQIFALAGTSGQFMSEFSANASTQALALQSGIGGQMIEVAFDGAFKLPWVRGQEVRDINSNIVAVGAVDGKIDVIGSWKRDVPTRIAVITASQSFMIPENGQYLIVLVGGGGAGVTGQTGYAGQLIPHHATFSSGALLQIVIGSGGFYMNPSSSQQNGSGTSITYGEKTIVAAGGRAATSSTEADVVIAAIAMAAQSDPVTGLKPFSAARNGWYNMYAPDLISNGMYTCAGRPSTPFAGAGILGDGVFDSVGKTAQGGLGGGGSYMNANQGCTSASGGVGCAIIYRVGR